MYEINHDKNLIEKYTRERGFPGLGTDVCIFFKFFIKLSLIPCYILWDTLLGSEKVVRIN